MSDKKELCDEARKLHPEWENWTGERFPCGCPRGGENDYVNPTSGQVLCLFHKRLAARLYAAQNKETRSKYMKGYQQAHKPVLAAYMRDYRARGKS
jgi:hypothetical protein